MPKNKIEKSIHEKVLGALIFIVSYFRVEWSMLFYPKKTFAELLKIKTSTLSFAGGAFLVANILLAQFVGGLIGYRVEKFPFELPWVYEWLGDSSLLILRYLLGILVFLSLLRWFLKRSKIDISIPKTFSIICYASAIFAPFILAKRYFISVQGNILLNMASAVFSQTSLKLGIGDYAKFIFSLIVVLLFIIWWLWLIHLGLTALGARRTKAIICFPFSLFIIIQFIITSIYFVNIHNPFFTASKIILFRDMEKALSAEPPNYLKAALLAEKVANVKYLSPYYRYAAKIRAVAYKMATPLLGGGNARLVDKTLDGIKNRDYSKVQDILTKQLKKLLRDKTNPKRPLYAEWLNDLKEATELHDLPNYIDKQEELFICLKMPTSPIALFP